VHRALNSAVAGAPGTTDTHHLTISPYGLKKSGSEQMPSPRRAMGQLK
jgi:hypothetical protein